MGRPPLPLGTPGAVNYTERRDGTWRARCNFRDWDGVTRPVSRYGATKAKAQRALNAHITDRIKAGRRTIAPDLKVAALLDDWLDRIETEGHLATGTRQQYRKITDAYVKPALGGVRLGEVDVVSVDRALRAIHAQRGHAIAKSSRAVLSGALGLAAQLGALPSNPVRDAGTLRARKTAPQALTGPQVDDITDRLRAMPRAVDLDLPDLVEFMLYTGARIGEALACRDATLDLEAGSWRVDATVIRETNVGLLIQPSTKTASGERLLALPAGCVGMLQRRDGEVRLRGPHGVVFGSPARRSLRDPSNVAGDLRAALRHVYCTDCAGTGYMDGKVCQAAGDDRYKWVTFHTFRKTVATRMDEAGQSPRQAADQLGHAKPSMTADVYFGRKLANPDAARILDR